MRNRGRTQEPADINETVITNGIKIRGNIKAEANIWLDGVVEGNISSNGEVTLGENANVNGDISGANVMIGGKVKGNVNSNAKLIVLTGGRLVGNVETQELAVEDGGVIIGRITMPEPIEDSGYEEG